MDAPPLPVLLAYRLVGWRLGPRWHAWVLRDLTTPRWLLRQALPVTLALLVAEAVVVVLTGADAARLLALTLVALAGGAFLRTSLQDRALRQQGLDGAGVPLASATWYDDDAARRRRNLTGAVGTAVLVLGAVVLVALRHR